MIYKIGICDDEDTILSHLESIVNKWAKDNDINIKLETFSSAEAFLFAYEEDKSFNILLLDIEMPGMKGVDLAERIRKDNKSIQIVFITGYMDYIAQGYDVDALHYLIKPVDEKKLFEVLDKACDRVSVSEKVLFIESGGEMVQVPIHTITYAEVDKNYITIHTTKGDFSKKQPLSELEGELGEAFFRAGRSFIVNLSFVKRTSRAEVELKDGTLVPLSRGRYEAINEAIIKYF
ncbi:MAG: response regulator transcription factor [Tissierellia bacterium]|nr:response regulator transcription factor [Tissierellia bacterium]